MLKNPKNYFITLFALALFFSLAAPVLAANEPWFKLVPDECAKDQTIDTCGLSAMFKTIIKVSNLILMLTGSVALLMFMYGGARWILAAGKQEWIQTGTAAMTATVIGIVIILTSWLIVNFTIIALTGGAIGGEAAIFDSSKKWFEEQ